MLHAEHSAILSTFIKLHVHLSFRSLFCLFLSGRFTQVLPQVFFFLSIPKCKWIFQKSHFANLYSTRPNLYFREHISLCDFAFNPSADFPFLLRFLRAKKFSQLTARDTLLNYWTSKSKYPEWFANIDPSDKKLQEFMRCG